MPTTAKYQSTQRIMPSLGDLNVARQVQDVNLLGIVPVMTQYYFGGLKASQVTSVGMEFLQDAVSNLLLRDRKGNIVQIPANEGWPKIMWAEDMLFFDTEAPAAVRVDALIFLNAIFYRLGLNLGEVKYV
jgi:hypothetical protein